MRPGNLTQIWENSLGGGKSKPQNSKMGADLEYLFLLDIEILIFITQHLPELLFRFHNGFTGHQALFYKLSNALLHLIFSKTLSLYITLWHNIYDTDEETKAQRV